MNIRTLIVLLAVLVPSQAFAQAASDPNDTLTPGETRTGELHAKRPSLSPSMLATLRAEYHLAPHEKPAEWDHRIPWGCLGATSAKNLWPQDASKVHKDRLEHWAERQVTLKRLTVEACQEMFAAPNRWQDRYRVVFKQEP